MKPSPNVAPLIQRFFTERLMRQRNVSANTIAFYRDTFRLLFRFAQGSGSGQASVVSVWQANPLPAGRSPARLPGGAVRQETMPNGAGAALPKRPQMHAKDHCFYNHSA